MANDQPILAIKGLPGWTVHGRCSYGTFRSGPYATLPEECPHAVDMTPVYNNQSLGEAIKGIWNRASLDLALPDNHVRNLFEGCIGFDGTIDGHAWDGSLASLQPSDSVGLMVYLAILANAGGVTIR